MTIKLKFLVIGLVLFGALGWAIALSHGGSARAGEGTDDTTIDLLYDTVFHRPADTEGKKFYRGMDIKSILTAFKGSHEMRYYGALFKAVKSYEEAQRTPGTLTAEEKQSYLDLIDSSLATLLAWVETLPDQEPCKATIGPEQAREAIQRAYERLEASGKTGDAEHGLFNALRRIGPPNEIKIHPRCLRPTPTAIPGSY